MTESPVKSLYVHVPFCAKKCSYCAFYSEASDGDTVGRYVNALTTEIRNLPEGFAPETIFFGGGTPSLLSISHWKQVLACMEQKGLLGAKEFTVECNPATVSLDKGKLLRDYGVNRASLGIQSFDEQLLHRLGRIHTREQAVKSFDLLRKAGFENLNLDLMFAIPGQGMETWRETLRAATALQSEHLSSYEVIYEDDTPLYRELEEGKIKEDEDLACEMYEELVSHANQTGYFQYEIANFARNVDCLSGVYGSEGGGARIPDRACMHNVNYWRGGQFYGLGPSATSYLDGVRTRNVANTQIYCRAVEERKTPAESAECLPPLGRAGEIAAFGLRMVIGWPFEHFKSVSGFDLRNEWAGEMQDLERQGLGVIEPDRFRLSSRGLRFADAAAQMFLR